MPDIRQAQPKPWSAQAQEPEKGRILWVDLGEGHMVRVDAINAFRTGSTGQNTVLYVSLWGESSDLCLSDEDGALYQKLAAIFEGKS